MNLHPAGHVAAFCQRNQKALSLVHKHFADIVPQVFAELESRHPDGNVHGGVFSAIVRDAFLVELERRQAADQLGAAAFAPRQPHVVETLTAFERPFRSVRFLDAESWRCRIHMHPKDLKTGHYLPTLPADDTLFGPTTDGLGIELAVLWKPSRKTKALKEISLAAVSNLQDRRSTAIYASTPLPPIAMTGYWAPEVTEYNEDPGDFDELLEGDESLGDDTA